jgi:uncharacterized protein YkwD
VTSFYIILIAVMITGAVLGYLLGAAKIIIAGLKMAAVFVAVYFLFEPLALWLVNYCTLDFLYAYALSVSAILLFSLITIELLTRSLLKCFTRIHGNIFNRLAGLLSAGAAGTVACLFFVHYYTTIAIPQTVSVELEQAGIAQSLDETVRSIAGKFISFSEQQPVQVMAVKELDPVKPEGVDLSFSTSNYTLRPQLEYDMLQWVNKERVKRGLRSLSSDSSLLKAARLHAADMLARGYFSHNTPEGFDPFQRLHKLNIHYRYAGENLALAPTLLQAHEGLMRSPGHKANILHPSYGRIGIGVLDAGIYGLMITQEFRD